MDKIFKIFGKSKKIDKQENINKLEKQMESADNKDMVNTPNTNNESNIIYGNQNLSKTEKNNSNNTDNDINKGDNILSATPDTINSITKQNTQIHTQPSQTQAIHSLQSLDSNFSFLSMTENEKANDVVSVNTQEQIHKSKLEGYYYKKYMHKIHKLTISNPILIEREKMKITFDSEVMDYLINDLTMIFRDKQKIIDENQVK